MKTLDVFLTSPTIQMFGWALLHSFWQGIILAALLKGFLNLKRNLSANTRYLIACTALLLTLLLPVSTALWNHSAKPIRNSGEARPEITEPGEIIKSSETIAHSNILENASSYKFWIHRVEKQFLSWAVLLWLIGVSVSSLRLIGAWTFTRRLKLSGKHLVAEQWREALQKLCREMKVSKPIILLESSLVRVPTVAGWLKPIILIPSCALTGLTPQQFELILAHELAHIRRHDYLVNLFQTIVETILFYHPAVWWVSNRIRQERENACDDLAVNLGGDAVAYARTLIEVERLRKVNPSFAMAADGGSLTARIHRLIGSEISDSKRPAGAWIIIFICILMAAVLVTAQNSSLKKESANKDFQLNLPPLTIEDLREGEHAAQNVIAGEWTAEFNPNKSDEVKLNIRKQSKGGGINGSINTLPVNEMQGLAPDVTSSSKINVNFKILREAGSFVFEGYFSEGKGSGFWKLTPSQAFVSDMRRRGYDNLPENYLFYAATEDINAKLIDDLESAGYVLSFKELIQAASYKITPESFQAWREAGFKNISFKELSTLGEHDVTFEYIEEIKAEGFQQITLSQAIKLKDHDIGRDFIRRVKASFPNATLDELVKLRTDGIVK